MKYVIEIGSGATIYIRRFMKIDSGIQKFMGAGNSQTHTPIFILQNKSRLKINCRKKSYVKGRIIVLM
jgi:hypothetical protein